MKEFLLGCGLVILLLGSSSKGWAAGVKDCVTINGDTSRLRCYDLAAGRTLKKSTTKGKWRTSTKNNPLDDSTTATAVLEASEGKSQWGKGVILVARCMSNKTEAYVNWNDYLGDDDDSVYRERKRITYRLDSSKAISVLWGTSTDRKAVFVDKAISFLKQLVQSDQLVMQTTPYNESPVTAIFNLEGALAAIRPIAETCHWSLGPKTN
jgi:type VI secretion system protein VasI